MKQIYRKRNKELEEIEIHLLLEGIFQRYGYDFRDYAAFSRKRRILKCVEDEKTKTISALQDKILHDVSCMERFLDTMSVTFTEMFRDPFFYLSFRKIVAPQLKELPSIRIWLAGVSTGEEVYSMAILLKEEGLLNKSRVYATDFNRTSLEKAKEGIYSLKRIRDYTNNYFSAGGTEDFSDYYSARYDHAIFKAELRNKIVWAEHNLVTDWSFNEFDIIIIRNVMIYFNDSLQNHVYDLLFDSLFVNGYLILGSKENLKFSKNESCYETIDLRWKIYKKIKDR